MINFDELKETLNPNMRGGEGAVKAQRFVRDEITISRLTLEQGCSIGLHRHETTSEVLYIVSGEACFTLNGQSESVRAGECHYCPKGSEHCVVNRSKDPLVMIAVIPEV